MIRPLLAICTLVPVLAAASDRVAERVGVQYVTTFAFLDHLAKGVTESPHLPAKRPLYVNVDKKRKAGTTVQNPWGGDGKNRHMRVRVRKTRTDRVMKDLRDCLVLPLPGRISWDVDVLPGSVLLFSPEFVRMGTGAVRMRVLADGVELWSDVVQGKGLFKNKWDEVRIPLDSLAGRTVKLTFEVDKPSLGESRWEKRGKHKGVGLFALPRIVTRVDAKDKPQRAAVKAVVGDDLNYNVVMFVFDSGRADLMSPVREERGLIPSITPNLDKFMKGSAQFSRAFSVGNQTRIGSYSFYLSMPPAAGGFWSIKWGLSPQFRRAFYRQRPVSLPRRLKKAGYLTGHLGFNGFLTGFQYLSLDMGFDFVGEYNGVPENTVRMTDGITEWLEQHKDQKFFLLVWFDPPHFPYNPPKQFVNQIYKAGVPKNHKFFSHRFLGKMAYGDHYFGKIADRLTELGLDKKTLYIVSADHGEAMDLRHDGYSHNVDTKIARHHGKSFYDEEIHVPLTFELPGVVKPRVVKNQVSLMSLGPTILDLLGLKHRFRGQMGRSFAKLVRGRDAPDDRLIYFEGRWSYGIRWKGYKYIFHDPRERLKLNRESLWQRERDGTDEIFDTNADPFELTNIATSNPEIRAMMRQKYKEWREEMRAFRRKRSPKGAIARPISEELDAL